MAEAGRRAQAPSLRPSLSLPVFDSTRSAREGSFPFFPKVMHEIFINQTQLPSSSQRWTGASRSSPTGPQNLPASLPESTHSQLRRHPPGGLGQCQTEISTRSLDSKIQLACPWYSYFLFSYQYQMHG